MVISLIVSRGKRRDCTKLEDEKVMTEEEDEEENGEYWEVNQIINQVDLSEIEERREIPD